MPALKYLTLERVNNWLPGTFSGLVHFNLTADFDDSYVLNSLLDVLRNSPDLQELLVCHRSNGLPDDQDVESVENPINMGKLSVLIGSKMTRYQAYRLLSWLRIPSSATIAMFNMVTLPERVPLSVLPTDPANLPSLQRPQKLWIWKSSHLMTTDADYRPLLFMSLKEECKKTWSQDNNIFNYFDCDLPLAALINELRLVGDVPLDAGTSYWTETLRAMPTLELIDLKLPLEDIRTILSLFSVLSCPEGSLRCSPIHTEMVKSLEDGIRAEADNPSSSHPLVQLSFRVNLGEHPAYMCVKVNQAEFTLNSTAPFIRTIVKRYRATEVMESSYTIEVPELWRAHWQGDWPAVQHE
ncbi:hypothetical protein PHLCEN_2v10934 [Hermanssonia centrifuga]|uniref:Uncharacterized protein n=1 Tax=Hermanssonia centrifuga TaxID=98765 RepID=A0A2R6NMG0_9APHY|nr:hypothetical protein PHLCEN_2v10934 [Hermanssonia centrifuga]